MHFFYCEFGAVRLVLTFHDLNYSLKIYFSFIQGGDSGIKRAKVDKELEVNGEGNLVERSASSLEQHMASTSLEPVASTSEASTVARTERSGFDKLPKEMNEMRIRDEKTVNHDDKVLRQSYLEGFSGLWSAVSAGTL